MGQTENAKIGSERTFRQKVSLLSRNLAFILRNASLLSSFSATPEIRAEFAELVGPYQQARKALEAELNYTSNYDVRMQTGLVIYGTVRQRKPAVMVETGVANGFSARLILSAMNRNGSGTLYSVDIRDNVGKLVEGIDKSRWRLRIGSPESALSDALREIPKVDIFMHDSDHSYENMSREFSAVEGRLAPGSLVMSDDVDTNPAFMEFARRMKKRPRIFADARRCFGCFEI
jgi:predicted O-methyltransferase YrrM